MINFTLNNIDNTPAWGKPPDLRLHWFNLTLGEVHIEFGETKIFEYSKEAIKFFGLSTQYNEYQISRFIEDFSELFEKIGESIPAQLYTLTENLPTLLSDFGKWQNKNDSDDLNFHFDTYSPLRSWVDERHLTSNHLVYGPNLYFFRHNENIRVVWEVDGKLENGANVWTAQSGNFEMPYNEFVKKIAGFRDMFFEEMSKKIHQVANNDLRNIHLNKAQLVAEHSERTENFSDKLYLLNNLTTNNTNWTKIELLHKNMMLSAE